MLGSDIIEYQCCEGFRRWIERRENRLSVLSFSILRVLLYFGTSMYQTFACATSAGLLIVGEPHCCTE